LKEFHSFNRRFVLRTKSPDFERSMVIKMMFNRKDNLENCPKCVRTALKELNIVLPVVQRVHGDAHPELAKVSQLVDDLQAGLSKGNNSTELCKILDQLHKVTNGYTVTSDACGGFQKEYQLLSQIDVGIRTEMK